MAAPGHPPLPEPVRDRIERALGRWGHFVYRRSGAVAGLALAVTAAFVAQLPSLEFDLSEKGFLHPTDPVRVTYEAFNRQFGRDATLLVAVESEDVFGLEFLERLRALHREIEALPQLEEVTSLVNARNTYGRGDELVVEDLLEAWPADDGDLAALRQRVFANPLFPNQLVSEDGRATTISIHMDRYSSLGPDAGDLTGFEEEGDAAFLTQDEEMAIAAAILELAERHQAPGFRVHVSGGPVLELWILVRMQRDILRSVAVSTLLIALLLYLLFRRLLAVVLPLGVVLLALLCAMGSMAWAGVPVTLPMQILPSFLLAVGVCGVVHILVLVFRELDAGRTREDAIAAALSHSGLPVVMAGLTTAGGLASFATSPLLPVAHFGIFGPLGVLFTLAFALVLLPALLAVAPLRPRPRATSDGGRPLSDRVLLALGAVATRRPRAILAATLVLVALAALGALRIRVSHHPLNWLPEQSAVRVATDRIDQDLGGAGSFEVLLATPGLENGFQDPELLARMDELRGYALALEVNGVTIANSVSIADVLKETHRALNENRTEYYQVPRNPRLVAQELLLFENSGSDDLEDLVDSRFSLASFTLRVPWLDAVELTPLFDEIERAFSEKLGELAEVTLTGGTVVFSRTLLGVTQSMARSYALALLIVTPLMILLIGTLRGGLISMIPNLTPIVLTLGLMGWLDFRIDFSSMMIGAIVLGIAVDDTIHFMHVFQRSHRELGDARVAVRRTMETTGRAILFTSVVLCVGFLGFGLSSLKNLVATSVLTCFAIATAFLADVLLAPALMVLVSKRPEAAGPAVSAERRAGLG